MELSHTDLVDCCFRVVNAVDKVYKCLLCNHDVKSNQRGKSNLLNHLTRQHPHTCIEHTEKCLGSTTTGSTFEYSIDPKIINIYSWLDLMADRDIPLTWCNDPKFVQYLKLEKVAPNTLKKYMIKTGLEVERQFALKVRGGDPNGKCKPLVMMIDLWDDGAGNKQLGVYLAMPDSSGKKAEYFLLCCTPLIDLTTTDANSQIETMTESLARVGLTWDNILLLSADNTAVSPAIARKLVTK